MHVRYDHKALRCTVYVILGMIAALLTTMCVSPSSFGSYPDCSSESYDHGSSCGVCDWFTRTAVRG